MLLRPKETLIDQDYGDAKDLYYVAYNSFYRDHKALLHVMNLQQNYMLRPSFGKRPICILFFYTDITTEIMDRLLEQMEECTEHMQKVAIVGVPVNARAWFRLKAKRHGKKLAPYQFFSNTKSAINWLHT